MIRTENHRGLRPHHLQQPAEHHVVIAVSARDHVLVHLVILVRDRGVHLRRMVVHEAVAEVVDGVVVDGREVPRLVLDQPRGRGVDRATLGHDLRHRDQPVVLVLVDLGGIGHEGLHLFPVHVAGIDPQFAQRLGQPLGVDHAGGHRLAGGPSPVIMVGDKRPLDRLGRMAGVPADHVRAQTGLSQNVPNRLDLPRGAGRGADAAGGRVGLGEAQYAVFVGPLARSDRRPEHGREDRLERGQIAHHSFIDHA